MFTSLKEYKKQLNKLNPKRKLIHIENTLDELKEIIKTYPSNESIRDKKNLLKRLNKLKSIRTSNGSSMIRSKLKSKTFDKNSIDCIDFFGEKHVFLI